MNQERQDRVKRLFLAACELDEAARTPFLDQACRSDPDLRAEVDSLLKHHHPATLIDPAATVTDDYPSSALGRTPAAPPLMAEAPRFTTGSVVADRYRIVSLLGQGGMGEVYRADDLKLNRPVALKFITQGRADDPAWLARFYNEARLCLAITNRYICRVYDVGDADGEAFISMEYIDGENLATLLKRIGRLPVDKAMEITRELCTGLAAAHSQNVLHRDLKPANIMLDGQGRVRITDFGIAALAESPGRPSELAGTPRFMAPELLKGQPASIGSDIYALGMILYEMVTGERPFPSRGEAARTRPIPPSEHVPELSPAFDRVILACLAREPDQRPATVYEILSGLPGGDPLAAALAAGELPSPTLLVHSRSDRPMRPATMAGMFLLAVVAMGIAALLSMKTSFFVQSGLTKSPDVLEDRARQILQAANPDDPPPPLSGSFVIDPRGLYLLRAGELDKATSAATPTPVVSFDCRSAWRSGSLLSVFPELRTVARPDPVASRTRIRLDPQGRLLEYASPPPRATSGPGAPTRPDWSFFFEQAGLKLPAFQPATVSEPPPVHADGVVAWEPGVPGDPEEMVRVEGAAVGPHIVYFAVRGPWELESMGESRPYRSRLQAAELTAALFLITLAVSLGLAWKNLRDGTCDRRGAFRLALFVAILESLLWAVRQRAGTEYAVTAPNVLNAMRVAVFTAFVAWVYYLALEPYVRRFWPHSIISWSRALAGGWRDPLVGYHVLAGAAFGAGVVLLQQVNALLPVWTGHPSPLLFVPGSEYDLGRLAGFRYGLEALSHALLLAIGRGMMFIVLMLLLRLMLRRSWLTGLAFLLVSTPLYALSTDAGTAVGWAMCAIVCAGATIVLLRAGLLALVVGLFTIRMLLATPITLDPQAWYAGTSGFTFLVLGILVVAGASTRIQSMRSGQASFR